MEQWSPTGKVPVLWVDDEPVWDSLAICETLAELFPDRQLWPSDPAARRMARAVSAEMHSGFGELRKAMPMNIRSSHPDKGRTPGVAQGHRARGRHLGGLPQPLRRSRRVAVRDVLLRRRDVRAGGDALQDLRGRLPPQAQRYADAVRSLPSVQEWCAGALAEKEFVPADEPYAVRP